MKKKTFNQSTFFMIIPISLILLSIFYLNFLPTTFSTSSDVPNSIGYKGFVCVQKNHESPECSHNQLYNLGKNMTRDALGVGSTAVISNISLCNATSGCGAPVAGASELYLNYTSCGLGSTQGTYSVLTADNGNWTISKTFTVSAGCNNNEVNATRLTNATGSAFAGNSFTLVTLQPSDQLTINWTISIL